MSVQINIGGLDRMAKWSHRQRAALSSTRILNIVTAAGAKEVRKNFRALDHARHRGLSTKNYYGTAADATTAQVRGTEAYISIDHTGIALRRFGGTVRPRVAKYLTIPVDPVAHGKRVREFGDAVAWIINRRTGKGVVTLGGRVIFILTKESKHKPDPKVLPTDKELGDAMGKVLDYELERI